jgi:hypothetical protein
MTVTYRTIILQIPPTTPPLLPERWVVDHWCNLCRGRVESGDLIVHAQAHENAGDDIEDGLPIREGVGHNGVRPH